MSSEPIGCAVLVINDQNQVLLGKRKSGYNSGTYGLPGGRVDGDERMVDGAVRELQEETGLVAKEIKYVGVVKEWQQTKNFIHFIYVCKAWDGQPETMEPGKCDGWGWYDLDDLPENVLKGHKLAVELYLGGSQMIDV